MAIEEMQQVVYCSESLSEMAMELPKLMTELKVAGNCGSWETP
jgi:hypothetical protein